MPTKALPTEVELVFEVMPCQSQRASQQPDPPAHSCTYFRSWGTYHSFDYDEPGPPKVGTVSTARYVGRAALVPELLSGCRKAPILAVGINPNLPGWYPNQHGALNPVFDDYRQYAHYFRYRRTAKPELSNADYQAFGGGPADEPPGSKKTLDVPADASGDHPIAVRWRAQSMYLAYQGLLDDLAAKEHLAGSRLQVGEDLAYANMVACPSAKWTTKPLADDPRVPPMTNDEQTGIVGECFVKRRYFLRQLFQSLPSVILVFSTSTAQRFVAQLQGRFSAGNPKPNETAADLLGRVVLLHYGDLPDGKSLEARVIFAPHPTGTPAAWNAAKPKVLEQLSSCFQQGRLRFNPTTGHLFRPLGSCVFCTMLDIGPCDYVQEIKPLAVAPELASQSAASVAKDRPQQDRLLARFTKTASLSAEAWTAVKEGSEEGIP